MLFESDVEADGRRYRMVAKGTQFRVEKVVAIRKHGFEAVDSGPGPLYYYVLNDGR
jgi:hypothetical protein